MLPSPTLAESVRSCRVRTASVTAAASHGSGVTSPLPLRPGPLPAPEGRARIAAAEAPSRFPTHLPEPGCHLVRPCPRRRPAEKCVIRIVVLRWSGIAPRCLLSRPVVIVPDYFHAQEGLTGDDVQDRRPVTHNEVL